MVAKLATCKTPKLDAKILSKNFWKILEKLKIFVCEVLGRSGRGPKAIFKCRGCSRLLNRYQRFHEVAVFHA